MEKKQTAVEWLMENLHIAKDPFGQAKQIEKQQIVDAYYYDPNCDEIKDDGEQYYNETYNP